MKIRKMQNAGVAETPNVDLPYQASSNKSDIQDHYPNIIDNYHLEAIPAYAFLTRKSAKAAAESDAFMGVEKRTIGDPEKLTFNRIYDKKYDKHQERYYRNFNKWYQKWGKYKAQEPGVYVSRAAEAIAKGEIPPRYFDQRYMPEIQSSYEYQTDPARVTDQRFLDIIAGVANAVPLTAGLLYYTPAAWKILNWSPTQAYFTGQGIYNAFSGNGVAKTYNHFKNGEIWDGTKSLVGDVLDIGIPGVQAAKAVKLGKEVYNTTNNASDAFKYGLRELPIANLFQGNGYKLGKELFLNPEFKKINNIPIYHGTKYMGDDFVVHGWEPGVHVGISRTPSDDIALTTNGVVREGYYTYTGNIEKYNDVRENTAEALIDQSLDLTRDQSKKAYLQKLKNEINDQNLYPRYDPIFPPGQIDGKPVDRRHVEIAKKLIDYYRKEGISGFKYKNLYEGGDDPSMILFNPNNIHLSKTIADTSRKRYMKKFAIGSIRQQSVGEQTAAQKLAESLDLPNNIYGQALRDVAERDARYYLPIKRAIKDFNGNAEEALKAIITDRNTVYGTMLIDPTDYMMWPNMDMGKLVRPAKQDDLLGIKTSEIGELRTAISGGATRGRDNPEHMIRHKLELLTPGYTTDVYYNDLPQSYQRVSGPLTIPLYFKGSPFQWFDINNPTKNMVIKTPGDKNISGISVHLPEYKTYLDEEGAKIVEGLLDKENIVIGSPDYNSMNGPATEVVFEGPVGVPVLLPSEINSGSINKKIPFDNVKIKLRDIPSYYESGSGHPSWKNPLMPFGYKGGGKLKINKAE